NVAVTKVEFYANNVLQATDTASPYSFSWNTASGADGSYSLSTRAYDAAGNVGQSAAVNVNVKNAVVDTIAPAVSVTSPTANSTVKGTLCAAVAASDNIGVTKVEYYVNSSLIKAVTASPFGYCMDTTLVSNGNYSMYVNAYDAAGNVTQSKSVRYKIRN
ncbi:MAG: Ig-like domain-containing protein, partial [Desulfuromonadaceae bacterium]|nr:Ig-like domain-containing protein [Desulfuromonadaceae bacterium]